MGKKKVAANVKPETQARFVTRQKDSLEIKRYESLATLSSLVNAFCLASLPGLHYGTSLIKDPISCLTIACTGTLCVQFYIAMHFRVWWKKDEKNANAEPGEEPQQESTDRWKLSRPTGATLEVSVSIQAQFRGLY